MQDRRTLRGLGTITLAPVPKPTISVLPTVPTTTATTAVKPTIWDTINKGLTIGQKATDIYTSIKTGTNSNSGVVPPNYYPQPTIASDDEELKQGDRSKLPIILAVTAGIGVVGTIVYFAVRGKNSKK